VILTGIILASLAAPGAHAQSFERMFPQSKATVESALKMLQPNLAGRLPSLEGFAQPGEHALDRYQRGFYQATVQVTSTPSGRSLVPISTKVTAWYNDPSASHSAYQLLTSNGRLEADLLDQLGEQLSRSSASAPEKSAAVAPPKASPAQTPAQAQPPTEEPAMAAPASQPSETDRRFSSSLNQSLAEQERAAAHPGAQPVVGPNNGGSTVVGSTVAGSTNVGPTTSALQAEAESLQEILKNQAHPKNLVAVKKSGTPVVSAPSLTAKPQFLASMHDEFEMLDFNADWVHVRISGLSRGWIWRNSVEMPEGIPDTAVSPAPGQAVAADLFRVSREETAPFPGDWAPLRGKTVKILSVQKADGNAKDAGPNDRLAYTKFLFEKNFPDMAKKPQDLAGLVVIFDSADGGMIAATLDALQQWRAGTLSDSALWHKCFFDPPETFDSAGSSASQ